MFKKPVQDSYNACMKITVVAFRILCMALALWLSGCASTGLNPGSQATSGGAHSLMDHYLAWQGTPYRWGGASRKGVDCSSFAQLTYQQVYRMNLPRHTRDQARAGSRVSRRNLKGGDLVFFKTGWFSYHVGVYVGNNRFIHASESKGVTQSSLNSPYWDKHYWKARRIHS